MIVCITIISCMLLFQILIAAAYYSKERVDTVDNRLYGKLLVSTLLGLVLELLCYITIIESDASSTLQILAMVVNKMFLVYLLIWEFLFTAYVVYISFNGSQKIVDIVNKKYQRIYFIFLTTIGVLSLILIALPLEFHNDGVYVFSYGLGTNVLTLFGCVFVIVDFICFFRNIKHIVSKKYVPLIVMILLMMLIIVLRVLNPGITIINSCFAFVTIIMYFTIENPDVKMIQALEVAREQADKANRANLMTSLGI